MSDFNPPIKTPSPAGDDPGDHDNALAELIVRYLNDRVFEEEGLLLSQQLDGNARRQALFVRLARLHGLMSEWGRLMAAERGGAAWNLLNDPDDVQTPGGAAGVSLHDAVVQPALTDADAGRLVEEELIRPPQMVQIPHRAAPSGRHRWWIAAAAMVAIAGVILMVIPRNRPAVTYTAPPKAAVPTIPVPVRPPAVITAFAAAALDNTPLTQVGTTLADGQVVDLTAGAIEVTFDSGAVVAITAPTRFRIADRNAMALEKGSLAAHVPPSGIGFRVDGADMTVVDQGTDFGLRPDAKGSATELHVFQGAVDVMAGQESPAMTKPLVQQPVRVRGGNAVVCSAATGTPLTATTYAPESFVHHIDEYRVSIDLHGTGQKIAFKSADPNWTLAADPAGEISPPRDVYASEMRPTYFFAASEKSKWISTGPAATNAPPGKYTFRTTLVLPDFAAGTATVTGTWGVDDQLVDVVVNGVSTAKANAELIGRVSRTRPVTWALRGAPWKSGSNRVDVIVGNNPSPAGVLNQTALNVSFTATYLPPVSRSKEAGPSSPATLPTGQP